MKPALTSALAGLALLPITASADDRDSQDLAAKLTQFTHQDAQAALLELETKLDAETAPEPLVAEHFVTKKPEPRDDQPDRKPKIVDEMEHLMVKVEKAAATIRNLKGPERAARIAEWNAKHDAVEAKLFKIFQKESENGISDDIAPVLERINNAFQIEAGSAGGD